MEELNTENTQEDLKHEFDYFLNSRNFASAQEVIKAANSLEMFDLARDMSRELEETKVTV